MQLGVENIRPLYTFGECRIDLAQRELRIRGSPVPIGGRAFEFLEVLVRSAGKLVTKDELMNRVWPGAIVTENTLHVHATAIRKALGPSRNLLKTEPGRGYRLLGDWTVRRQDAETLPVGRRPVLRVGASAVTNFPETVTRLIGRTAAVARLRDLLSAYRVVTLTGPGGIGKTSLALKAARGVVGDFAGGAWLIELASLSDPTLVPSTIVGVLGLKLGAGVTSDETVARAIGDSNLLLLLDNCEHVIDAAASLIETVIYRCPSVTVLATSREVLRVSGEYVYRVAPLDVPDAQRLSRHAFRLHSPRYQTSRQSGRASSAPSETTERHPACVRLSSKALRRPHAVPAHCLIRARVRFPQPAQSSPCRPTPLPLRG